MIPEDDIPVTEQTYQRIRTGILDGTYPPGVRLTSVRLADDLGVSRTPVRAALTRLKSDGLVESSDNKAAWVPALTVDAVEEAYEIAGSLEPLLVRKLAQRIDPADLQALEAAVTEMERSAGPADRERWVDADERFHHLVREAAGRQLVASMLARVDTVIDRVRFLSLNLRPEGAKVSAAEHRAVVDALRVGDPQLAQQRHEAHLARVREENIEFLKQTFVFGALPTHR